VTPLICGFVFGTESKYVRGPQIACNSTIEQAGRISAKSEGVYVYLTSHHWSEHCLHRDARAHRSNNFFVISTTIDIASVRSLITVARDRDSDSEDCYSLFKPLCFGRVIMAMAALCNRAGHYIFALWFPSSFFLSFFPRLISAAADWMSTILPHMVWS